MSGVIVRPVRNDGYRSFGQGPEDKYVAMTPAYAEGRSGSGKEKAYGKTAEDAAYNLGYIIAEKELKKAIKDLFS